MTTIRRRRDPVLPLVLIGLGLILLVANLGWIKWGSLLGLLQLWPLALLAIGVDILLKGRYRLAVLVATLALGAVIYAGAFAPFTGPSMRTEQVRQTLQGAERASIQLETGVSELRLRALAGSDSLIEGTVQAARSEQIVQDFRLSDGTAFYELRSEQGRPILGVNAGRRTWELALTSAVPLELRVDTGVGRAELDLMQLQLTMLDVNTGVGSIAMTLPARGRYQATLDTGVGAATIRIPEGLAARIQVSRGVGAVTVRGEVERLGDSYQTVGYDRAEHRVDLRISSGVGAVTVEVGR